MLGVYLYQFLECLSHGEMSHKRCFLVGGSQIHSVDLVPGTPFRLAPMPGHTVWGQSATSAATVVRTLPRRFILRITYCSRLMYLRGSPVDNLQLYPSTSVFTVGQRCVNLWIATTAWQLLSQIDVVQHVVRMYYLDLIYSSSHASLTIVTHILLLWYQLVMIQMKHHRLSGANPLSESVRFIVYDAQHNSMKILTFCFSNNNMAISVWTQFL